MKKWISAALVCGGVVASGYAGTLRVSASNVTAQNAGFAYFATDTSVTLVDSLAAPNALGKLQARSGGASITHDTAGDLGDVAAAGAEDSGTTRGGDGAVSTSLTKAGSGGLAPNRVVPAPAAALLGVLGCSLLAGLRRKLS